MLLHDVALLLRLVPYWKLGHKINSVSVLTNFLFSRYRYQNVEKDNELR